MDITPPQEIIGQTSSQWGWKWWQLVLIAVAVLVVIWLGIAWFRGWFPFSYRHAAPQIPQEVLNSLTATGTPATVPDLTVKELSATSSATTTAPASVLDSLSSKK